MIFLLTLLTASAATNQIPAVDVAKLSEISTRTNVDCLLGFCLDSPLAEPIQDEIIPVGDRVFHLRVDTCRGNIVNIALKTTMPYFADAEKWIVSTTDNLTALVTDDGWVPGAAPMVTDNADRYLSLTGYAKPNFDSIRTIVFEYSKDMVSVPPTVVLGATSFKRDKFCP